MPQDLFAAVAYHCQQTAEKSLKGYLAYKKQPIKKTHDLARLLETCLVFDKNFEKLYQAISYLNPFATRFRYPTEFDIPDRCEAELALKHAETIIKFVLHKLSQQETGQKAIFD